MEFKDNVNMSENDAYVLSCLDEFVPPVLSVIAHDYSREFKGKLNSKLNGHTGSIGCMVAIPNGIASGSDGTVRIWDITLTCIHVLKREDLVTHLVVSGSDGTIRVGH